MALGYTLGTAKASLKNKKKKPKIGSPKYVKV